MVMKVTRVMVIVMVAGGDVVTITFAPRQLDRM